MPYITMQSLSGALARIGNEIESVLHDYDIEADDHLKETLNELQNIAELLYDAIECEELNETREGKRDEDTLEKIS
jgi:hypothetical protein